MFPDYLYLYYEIDVSDYMDSYVYNGQLCIQWTAMYTRYEGHLYCMQQSARWLVLQYFCRDGLHGDIGTWNTYQYLL